MMRQLKKLKDFDFKDAVVLVAVVSLIIGLALLSIAAALIIPSALLLALGYFRKWY